MITEILSGTIAGVCAAFVIQGIRAVKLGGLKKVRVFEPRGGQLNTEFYDYFMQQIRNAKEEIVVTGEGFGYKGIDGPAIADAYHSSMLTALRNNVDITRIQSARRLHPKWAEKLKECVREHPNKFHLYMLDSKEYQDIASVCVIDADSRNNVVEMMLSAENDLEDSPVRLASTGMFLHGRRDLAKALKENTLAIKKFSIAKKCNTEADIEKFLEN
tara:strand:+ start:2278 stop:2925 length:648 start_codon:yes stop_codon:yes gene_type:complete